PGPRAEPDPEPKPPPPKTAPKKTGPGPKPGEVLKPDDAMPFPGHTVTIRGKVSRVRATNQGKNIFLDFEGPDRLQTLKVLVLHDELPAHFERLPQKLVGSFAGKYVGQWIQVTGKVTARKLDAYVRPAGAGPFKVVPAPDDDRPLDPAWGEAAGGLAGAAQLKAVIDELRRRNPGYDGGVKEQLADGAVVGLEFWSPELFDLRPLAVLNDLARLTVVPRAAAGKLVDLRPLAGLHLKALNLAGNPRINDLKPLRDLPLEDLNLSATGVKDLYPLAGIKTLKRLHLPHPSVDLKPLRGLALTDLTGVFNPGEVREVLKALPDLEKIDGKPVAAFGKK
ncbi:MAG TPA: OB-fold nucleic acid binding domain-containing protein, partial [Gemmataceae bacterium]|nr:OB-fold nucleic acid binding domain-containing protein [Gemmataceae bacterium]